MGTTASATNLTVATTDQGTDATSKAQLSCNHRMFVPATVKVGDKVRCERCEGTGSADIKRRSRKVKALRPVTPVADPIAAVRDAAPAEVKGEATPAEVPTAAADRAERVRLAKAEDKALRAWAAAGQQGDRPATPNLDALRDGSAANVGARPAVKGEGRKVNARRAEANRRKAANEREARRVSEDELDVWIQDLTTFVEGSEVGTWNDELEHAYWTAGIAVSRPRWQRAVARVTGADYDGKAYPWQ